MRIILDTNIFITREDYSIIPANLQDLIRILHESTVQILLHPLSVQDIENDQNEERKKIIKSKIKSYSLLESPPNPEKDLQFLKIVGPPKNQNDKIDDRILYAIYRNAADFLITEDKKIHKKAELLGISQRVFFIDEALDYFLKLIPKIKVTAPPALREVPVHNLKFDDPIFDSLKVEYPEFKDWWTKISRAGRNAWVYYKPDGNLGAILIYKTENETIPKLHPILPANNRVKISTFKVTSMGYKIGELFLKMSFEFAIKNHVSEIYLTHFTKEQDDLVDLIEEFGFYPIGKNNGEDIYFKQLIPDSKNKSLFEIAKKFYPSFYDGPKVRKFIVPIWPEYHAKLFTDYHSRQSSLSEWTGEFIIEGNTIKKAYLSHSPLKKISYGDILLFYRSRDLQSLTSLGVVETVHHNLRNPDQIMRYVGKRTVYNQEEIEKFAQKPTKIIIFRWHFHLKRPIHQNNLLSRKIVSQVPQSITEITHNNYLIIKELGHIDKQFTITI